MSINRIFLRDHEENESDYSDEDDSTCAEESDSSSSDSVYFPSERCLNLVSEDKYHGLTNRIDLTYDEPKPIKLSNNFPKDYFRSENPAPISYLIFILQYSCSNQSSTCQVCHELIPAASLYLSVKDTGIQCVHAKRDCLNGAGYTSGRMMCHNVCVVSQNQEKTALTGLEENILAQCGIIKFTSSQQKSNLQSRTWNHKERDARIYQGQVYHFGTGCSDNADAHKKQTNRKDIPKPNKNHQYAQACQSSNQSGFNDDLESIDSFSILSVNSCSNISNIADDFEMLDLRENFEQSDNIEEEDDDFSYTF